MSREWKKKKETEEEKRRKEEELIGRNVWIEES